MTAPSVGARTRRDFTLDADAIRRTAREVGDSNPLHHSAAFAGESRFGELIASGAYTCGLLAGLLGDGFGEPDDGAGAVGMDYHVRFLGPVRVDRAMRMEWVVASHEPRRSGTVVRLEGSITDTTTGTVAVAAEMVALYFGAVPAASG